MYSGKVVKMDYKERQVLEDAMNLLETQMAFLKQEMKGDPEIKDIAEECGSAWAGLSDYLDIYDRQYNKEDL